MSHSWSMWLTKAHLELPSINNKSWIQRNGTSLEDVEIGQRNLFVWYVYFWQEGYYTTYCKTCPNLMNCSKSLIKAIHNQISVTPIFLYRNGAQNYEILYMTIKHCLHPIYHVFGGMSLPVSNIWTSYIHWRTNSFTLKLRQPLRAKTSLPSSRTTECNPR
jgi:hypothetical protein